MKIIGLQKLTLIDYPEKVACTLFLYGCNFRCGFCHNPELVVEDPKVFISTTEVLNFLEKRKKYLDAICITGGEPLLSLNKDFLKKIKALGYLIKIDTNGSFPEQLREILNLGLVDYIAMDIKASKEKYNWVVNSGIDLNLIEESMCLIYGSGVDYEFRTTIVPGIHDKDEIVRIGQWVNEIANGKPKKYFLQGFRNQGKFIDEKYKTQRSIEEDYLNVLKKIAEVYFEKVEIRV